MSELIVIIVLLVIIILVQIAERFLYSESSRLEKDRLLDELSKLNKAVISKNANEYMAAVAMDKVDKNDRKIESDEVLLSEADDATFDKAIKAAK